MTPRNTPGYRAGGWLIISGQTGRIGEALVPGGFAPQFRQALANLARVLASHDVTSAAVAKVNIYLADMANYTEMNEIYAECFAGHLPARTTVGVNELSRKAAVEIEAWAYVG